MQNWAACSLPSVALTALLNKTCINSWRSRIQLAMNSAICPENLRLPGAEARGASNPIASSRKLWQNMGLMPQRPPLSIAVRVSGDTTILDLTGDITLFNSPEIRKALITQLRDKRVPHLLVNMLAVPYVDSSGVASLVEGLKISRDLNSRFALYGLSKSARTVLELTHLLRIFEVHQTEQEALEAPPPASFDVTSHGEGK
jgi:anti-sigma B factor antagonist